MSQKLQINNKQITLKLHLNGGSVISLKHAEKPDTDVLNFSFTKKQMREIGNTGAPFKGHFICCPYWGSSGTNQPWHGPFAAGKWQKESATKNSLVLASLYKQYGLAMRKEIQLHDSLPVFRVREKIENVISTPVAYNLVQHPTLQAPFLNDKTVIQTNAAKGLLQDDLVAGHLKQVSGWPLIKKGKQKIDMGKSIGQQSVVASFAMPKQEKLGWVTAYSPAHELLFGYCWYIADYNWLNIWKQVEKDKTIYTGLEFGTTGIHLNLYATMQHYAESLGCNNYQLLAPQTQVTKTYWAFLFPVKRSKQGVKNIRIINDEQKINIDFIKGTSLVLDLI